MRTTDDYWALPYRRGVARILHGRATLSPFWLADCVGPLLLRGAESRLDEVIGGILDGLAEKAIPGLRYYRGSRASDETMILIVEEDTRRRGVAWTVIEVEKKGADLSVRLWPAVPKQRGIGQYLTVDNIGGVIKLMIPCVIVYWVLVFHGSAEPVQKFIVGLAGFVFGLLGLTVHVPHRTKSLAENLTQSVSDVVASVGSPSSAGEDYYPSEQESVRRKSGKHAAPTSSRRAWLAQYRSIMHGVGGILVAIAIFAAIRQYVTSIRPAISANQVILLPGQRGAAQP